MLKNVAICREIQKIPVISKTDREYNLSRTRKELFTMSQGYLTVSVSTADEGIPIENARVYIRTTGFHQVTDGSEQFTSEGNVSSTYYNYILTTNSSGQTPAVKIDATDTSGSTNQNSTQIPYAVADVYVDAPGFFPVRIERIQIFAGNQSNLPVSLIPVNSKYTESSGGIINYTVPPNQLLIPDLRVQQGPSESSVEPFVTNEIYIPENVVVHLGPPSSNAENVSVPFTEYIKNVASSEIYPTWPENALRANIYAIITLTLNRIFTEWYPSQGYDFDITSSTGYDQAFVPGRNIFDNISRIVDEIFNSYVSKIGSVNPLFTQFCDGRRVQCEGMSQWGTVGLAEQGYTPLQILKYYYGNDVTIETAEDVRNIEGSYPGYPLRLGDSGEEVLDLQRKLMRIRQNYPAISGIPTFDGVFRASTDEAVRDFQEIFGLDVDGIVGKATWYKISFIYAAVTGVSEIGGEGIPEAFTGEIPDFTLNQGEQGFYVLLLQLLLNYISVFYPSVPRVSRDSIFGAQTANSLRAFQKAFGLEQTGVVTPDVWQALFNTVFDIIKETIEYLPDSGYPGTPLKLGDRNEAVRLMQTYLNALSARYPNISPITADGVFGPATQREVLALQRDNALPQTGEIDAATWERIVELYKFMQMQG